MTNGGSNNLMNWRDINPPSMYYVFHHIYGQFQANLVLEKLDKNLGLADPPPLSWDKIPNFPKIRFEGSPKPCIYYMQVSEIADRVGPQFCGCGDHPSILWPQPLQNPSRTQIGVSMYSEETKSLSHNWQCHFAPTAEMEDVWPASPMSCNWIAGLPPPSTRCW